MAVIRTRVQIKAPAERVWEIVSDLDAEPRFWSGTKSVRNISKEGNMVRREITIAFKDKKCMQEVTLYPKSRIEAVFTEGIIQGTKTLSIKSEQDGTALETVWDIRMAGMLGMFTGMVKKHIDDGTKKALQNIKDEAER